MHNNIKIENTVALLKCSFYALINLGAYMHLNEVFVT